jgi:tRNA A37 threonylcarbamoyladenosine biosynthesis protein TsaE
MRLLLPNEEATRRLAVEIGRNVEQGAIVALHGELGSGKTTFVKALAPALDVQELITSPTFVLMNEYTSGRVPLYHVDLYRLRETASTGAIKNQSGSDQLLDRLEFLKSELQELMQLRSVVVIEWAEFLDRPGETESKSFLKEYDHIVLQLEHVNKNVSARIADIKGSGRTSNELINKVAEKFGDMIICS